MAIIENISAQEVFTKKLYSLIYEKNKRDYEKVFSRPNIILLSSYLNLDTFN